MSISGSTPYSSVSTRSVGSTTHGRCLAEQSSFKDLFGLVGLKHPEPADRADLPVRVRHLAAGEVLFHEGAAPEFVYFVRSGTFKTFRTGMDGYEQVLGFVGRREVLGLDALAMTTHPSAAVSLEQSTAYALPLRDLLARDEASLNLEPLVYRSASMALNRQAELADVMSAAMSEVRLARFLLALSRRMVALGESGRRLRLRMCRRDIASHLGVAHETISRCFQVLADSGYLSVKDRDVEIHDLDALLVFSQGTRRQHIAASRASAGRAPRAAQSTSAGEPWHLPRDPVALT